MMLSHPCFSDVAANKRVTALQVLLETADRCAKDG